MYVGLPFLKAAKLAHQISVALPTSWSLGVGVSFSFLTGDVHRAPRWMQRPGLEWLHRLLQEPQRLFRRYILEDLPFLARAAPGALRERLRGGAPGRSDDRRSTTSAPTSVRSAGWRA